MELGAIAILYRDVDTAINFTLRAIAQFLGTERSCIFEFFDEQSHAYLIYDYRP